MLEALKQGTMPAGNGTCDVRAAANALHVLFYHYYVCVYACTENVAL